MRNLSGWYLQCAVINEWIIVQLTNQLCFQIVSFIVSNHSLLEASLQAAQLLWIGTMWSSGWRSKLADILMWVKTTENWFKLSSFKDSACDRSDTDWRGPEHHDLHQRQEQRQEASRCDGPGLLGLWLGRFPRTNNSQTQAHEWGRLQSVSHL